MMTKAEILKQTGLSEEEFYKKFPTQESFQEFYKGGKLPKAANGAALKQLKGGLETLGGGSAGAGAAGVASGLAAPMIDKLTQNGNESTQLFGSAASGAARGAASGAMFGPIGIGVGAVVGGASGYVQGKQEMRADALQDKNQAFTANLNEQAANIAKAQTGTDTSGYGVGQMKYGGMFKYGMGGPMYEAEGGEILQSNNLSSLYGGGNLKKNSSDAVKLEGPSHEQGGMPMSTNGEGRIFSDRLKPKGDKKNTFADLADVHTKELGKLEEAEKASSGEAASNTLKYMKKGIDAKLDELFNLQETQKADKEKKKAMREFKKGGWLKYDEGGYTSEQRMNYANMFGLPLSMSDAEVAEQLKERVDMPSKVDASFQDFAFRTAANQKDPQVNIPGSGQYSDLQGYAWDRNLEGQQTPSGNSVNPILQQMTEDNQARIENNINLNSEDTFGINPRTGMPARNWEESEFGINPTRSLNQWDMHNFFKGVQGPKGDYLNKSPYADWRTKYESKPPVENIDLEDEAYPSNETDYYSGNTFGLPGLGVRKPLSPDAEYQAPLFNYDDMMNNTLNGVMLPQQRVDAYNMEADSNLSKIPMENLLDMPVIDNQNINEFEDISDLEDEDMTDDIENSQLAIDNPGASRSELLEMQAASKDNSKTPGMDPNKFMIASAAPGIVNNLYRGLFGKVDQPFLGRASAMPGGAQALRDAGEYTAYNPAAELAANQAAAGRARAQMGRTGNLAAMMQGNLAAGRIEGLGASQILGGAERMNVQSINDSLNRKLGVRQGLMQDAKQTELFNLQQAAKEREMFDQGKAAKDTILSTGLGQLSAVGNAYASNKMQAAELAKLYSKLG